LKGNDLGAATLISRRIINISDRITLQRRASKDWLDFIKKRVNADPVYHKFISWKWLFIANPWEWLSATIFNHSPFSKGG
jgi:hypothetical protein